MTNFQTLQIINARTFQISQAVQERVAWIYHRTTDSAGAAPASWGRYRQRTVDRVVLAPPARVRVRRRLLDLVRGRGATSSTTDVVYGAATKPFQPKTTKGMQ